MDADSEKALPIFDVEEPAPRPKRDHSNVPGLKGRALRTMDFLVEHGVEERGIEPTPEDVSCRNSWLQGDKDNTDSSNESNLGGATTSLR